MVSKAAVIAIVAILAVPILLGYALNVDQVTETDYKTTGDPVNVSPLLQTGTGYTLANANTYQINSNFASSSTTVIPVIQFSNTKTSMPYAYYTYENGMLPYSITADMVWYYFTSTGIFNLKVYDQLSGGNLVATLSSVKTVYYDGETMKLTYTYRTGINTYSMSSYTFANENYRAYFETVPGNTTATSMMARNYSGDNAYADISKGYYFDTYNSPVNQQIKIKMPDKSHSLLYTINLNSITDSNYRVSINGYPPYILEKTTTDGVVSWKVLTWSEWTYPNDRNDATIHQLRDPDVVIDLYFDPDRSDNTYQIYQELEYGSLEGTNYYHNKQHLEFNYVGGWPSIIGKANAYLTYTHDVNYLSWFTSDNKLDLVFNEFYDASVKKTPLIRVDDAVFRSFEYPLIEDASYNPANFKTNPATKITDINQYGSSITFGGNTYAVKKGNITLGSHEIPVKDLVLSSVPNPNGGYDNKIGNTVVSTTGSPSIITFDGKWSASITTAAQEEYEITKTEWKAGDFAWDGIDHNFIMAGLLASLGAFIGVGIYARRTKSSVWPLLIVCGGAALLFFVML